MMNKRACHIIPLTALASAMIAVFSQAHAAEEDEFATLSKPGSTVSVGAGYVTEDNRRFGQYTGLNEDGLYGLLDLDFVRRDEMTGTWLTITGRSLGLDSREIRLEQERQGNWGYFLEYNQIPRFEPLLVNTALKGIGTSSLTRAAGPGPSVDLETMRKIVSLGGSKKLPDGFDFKVSFRNEEKDGERLFGSTGWGGFNSLNFLAEPIDSTTRQWEAVLSFVGEKLQVSGGYYGTSYNNKFKSIIVDGVTDGDNNTYSPIGLPPDNHSHQVYLMGGYNFTPTTRGNFKLAYGKIIQDDGFIPVTVAPGVGNDLDGEIETTMVQLGLTARPMPKLSMLANFRYEDRDDQTPILTYYTGAGSTSRTNGENEPRSIKTTAGKVEASYSLPMGFRLTGGVDYEEKERTVSPVRSVSAREDTEEILGRVELRRSLSETINGALSYVHSDRDGSDFLTNRLNGGGLGSNLVAPVFLADRQRDKLRLTLDWTPADPLSIQLVADSAWDDYDGRTALNLGSREGTWHFLSADASYRVSDAWQLTAFASYDKTVAEQASCTDASGNAPTCLTGGETPWQAKLNNKGYAFGLGLRGKPKEKLEVGADLQYSHDRGEFDQAAIAGTDPVPLIPDIYYRQTTLKLFAKYALQKNSGIRADYVYNRFKTDDWYWSDTSPPIYSDASRIQEDFRQSVNFFGLSYYYNWR